MAVIWLLTVIAGYLMVGICFLPFYYSKGIKMVDEGVKGSSFGFYIIIIPGVIVFWPILLRQWIKIYKAPKNEQAAA